MNIILSVLSGLLLNLALPNFDLFWLAWVALVPFFIALTKASDNKSRLWCGFAFGFSFFIISFIWILEMFRFAGWWVYFGWVSLSLFQLLFILVFAYGFKSLKRNPFLIALLWVALEYLRSLGPLGTTFGVVGYSGASFLPLIQIASFATVYGVSFLIVLVNAVLASRKRNLIILTVLVLIVVFVFGNLALQQPQETKVSLKLALIQPNIDQKTKIDPDRVDEVFAVYEKLTRKAAIEEPEVIIWPETSVFAYLLKEKRFKTRLQNLARSTNAWLVFGTPHYEKGKAYNSIISMSPSGQVFDRYDKRQLVPFGEYLPFRPLLYPLLKGIGYYDSEFAAGQIKPLKIGQRYVAASICFESVFVNRIRERVQDNSAFILLVTNDGWFADSSILPYHLNCGIFRAIENRKYFVQVANTGITAVIDPWGRVVGKLAPHQKDILFVEMPLR